MKRRENASETDALSCEKGVSKEDTSCEKGVSKEDTSCEEGSSKANTQDVDYGEVLLTAMEAGDILLKNGAEIFRVEETISRIARHFGVEEGEVFVLSNGIFMTGVSADFHHQERFAWVKHIPMQAASLDKVVEVNQLSRDMEEGRYTLEEVKQRLKEIAKAPPRKHWQQILASGIGAGSFSIIFGGDFLDGLAAGLAGLLLYLFLLKVSIPKLHLTKITQNLCGGALVTLLCILFYGIGFGHDLNFMIIGALMPLVPGIAFINGIRDIADCDYIAGLVRMVDAILVFLCLAIGVGIVFSLYQQFWGGMIG